MIKVLFIQDGELYKDEFDQYYGTHIDESIKQRYLMLGDTLTLLTRLISVSSDQAKKYGRIEAERFQHVKLPDFKSIKGYFTLRRKAHKIIQEQVAKHDVIVTRLPSASGNYAFKLAKKAKKPFLVEMVGCTFDGYWNYNWKGKFIAHYKLFKQQRIIKHSPFVIYVTSDYLQQKYPTKGENVNISNVKLTQLYPDKVALKAEAFLHRNQNQPLVIATIASLNVPYKGQVDVIRALAILKRRFPERQIKYKLVGQGDPSRLEEAIQKFGVEDWVEIIGPIKHHQVFEFLESVDLYIQPSKQEGLPRAVIEAMASGCPALGARTAGIPELLQAECIFKGGDYQKIADLISKVDNNWLNKQSTINFKNAQQYTHDTLKDRRRKFYKKFLNHYNISHNI